MKNAAPVDFFLYKHVSNTQPKRKVKSRITQVELCPEIHTNEATACYGLIKTYAMSFQ